MAQVLFVNTIVFVKDINISKKFYSEVLGLKILNSYDTITWFENNFTIHNAGALYSTIYNKELPVPSPKQGHDNIDIYFECNNLEDIYNKLIKNNVEFIHPIKKQNWGQLVMRFYDPDRHIVEIGEPLRINHNTEDKKI